MTKYLIIALLFVTACKSESKESVEKTIYPNVIGDINYETSDGEFKRCDTYSNQYYGVNGGLGYNGEMGEIKSQIISKYNSINQEGQTGFITIRFVVNCKGQAGMFRIHQTDLLLRDFSFNSKIVSQLLTATKSLGKWKIAEYEGNTYDYYQYLTYKLIDGKLIEIAP